MNALNVILAIGAILFSNLSAQEDLVTDRPDQTESAIVIKPGFFQLEAGWTFTQDDEAGTETETQEIPGTLLRIGLIDRIELRLGFSGYTSTETETGGVETSSNGAGDGEFGAKIYLWAEDGLMPETALLVGVSVPVGKTGISSEEWDPSFRFSFAHTLSESLSLGYNLGMAWESAQLQGGGDTTLSNFQYTAALGIGISDKLGAFVELFGDIPMSATGGASNSVDGGFTYLLLDNLQLDVASGFGISNTADDWFLGVGVSWRFPN